MRNHILFVVSTVITSSIVSCSLEDNSFKNEERIECDILAGEQFKNDSLYIPVEQSIEMLNYFLESFDNVNTRGMSKKYTVANSSKSILGVMPCSSKTRAMDSQTDALIRVIPFEEGGYAIVPANKVALSQTSPVLYIAEDGELTKEDVDIAIEKTFEDIEYRNISLCDSNFVYEDDSLCVQMSIDGKYVVYLNGRFIMQIDESDTTTELADSSDSFVDIEQIESIQDQQSNECSQLRIVNFAVSWATYLVYQETNRTNNISKSAKDNLDSAFETESDYEDWLSPIENVDSYIVKLPNGVSVRDFNFGQGTPYNYCQGHSKRKFIVCGPRLTHAYTGCASVAACAVAYQQGVNIKKLSGKDSSWPSCESAYSNVSYNSLCWSDEQKKCFGRCMKKIGDDCRSQHWYKGTSTTKKNFKQHFFQKYFYGADYYDFSRERLVNMIKSNRIPVIYGSDSGGMYAFNWDKVGHYWIATAYQSLNFTSGRTVELVYYDFGWCGASNGWFLTSEKAAFNHQNKIYTYESLK